mgnify:CR=1 FL=1
MREILIEPQQEIDGDNISLSKNDLSTITYLPNDTESDLSQTKTLIRYTKVILIVGETIFRKDEPWSKSEKSKGPPW